MKVLAFGTFDVFHPGHEFYLKESKNLGELIVVVARDSTVKELKGRNPLNNEEKRLKKIQSLDFVDKAVLGSEGDKLDIIDKIKPDIICLGYDQDSFNLEDKYSIKVKRIKAFNPKKYKSSLLSKKNGNA